MKKSVNLFILSIIIITLSSCSKDNMIPCINVAKTTIDVGESLTFTNCTKNGEKYLWQFGDGTNSEEASPAHTFKQAGDYVVTLSVVAPGLGATELKTNVNTVIISVKKTNSKFANLFNGTGTNTYYVSGSKGQDSLIVDSIMNVSFNSNTFTENENKVSVFLPVKITGVALNSETKFDLDIVNNVITIPATPNPVTLTGGSTSVGTIIIKSGIIKYDAKKVTIDYSYDVKFSTGTKPFVVHMEFFK